MPRDSMDWSFEEALDETKADLGKCERPDGLMILQLWKPKGGFHTNFKNVGMTVSEMVSLLEVVRHQLLHIMQEGHRP